MKLSWACALALTGLMVVGMVGIADCQTWTPMTTTPPASFGAMMLLTDGRVLLHEEPNCSGSTCKGKDYTAWYTLTPDINGNYATGTFTQVASTPSGYAPLYFASAVQQDGKVTAQGGEYQCPAGSCADAWQSLGAIYDPVQNTWTATTPPVPNNLEAMGDSESIVLADGTWMIGLCCAQFVGYSAMPDYVYFNENTLSFTPEWNLNDGQTTEFDEAGFNLLPYNPAAPNDSQVLMVNVPLGDYQANLATSQVYDETTNTWAAPVSTQVQLWDAGCGNSATASYELGPVMLLPNGTLWGTGASNCQAGNTATYNPATGAWTAQAPLPGTDAANDAPGATEINGNAIVVTSPYKNTFSTPLTIYEWNANTQTINSFPNVTNASKDDSYVTHLLVLPTGQILFTDFSTNGMELLTSAGTYQAAWQPTITTAPSTLSIGQSYPISGTQFNGLSQGAEYGDDFQDSTNYPLVRIVTTTNNHVYYARTFNHSTMGVATGTLPVSTNFQVPVIAAADLGACNLYVVANGIPSAASPCTVGQPVGIYSPVNGTPLSSTSVTFQWGGDPNATAYWVDIGSSQGGNQYYQSGNIASGTTSLAVTNLPSNGSTVYVTWYEMVNGSFQPTNYTYTAVGGANNLGSINTPAPTSTLTTNSQAFTWSAGVNATSYWLNVGSGPGASNYYNSGSLGNVVTATATGLPTNGSTLYVTLYSLVAGNWLSNSYTYTAYTLLQSGAATMTTPVPSSTLASYSVVFTWSTATGAQAYYLNIGSTPGSQNYYTSGSIRNSTHSETVKTLPTNGSTVYVTLSTELAGTWLSNAYTYTAPDAVSGAGGMMQTPTPGATLTSSSQTFTWSAGTGGATAYWLDVGNTPGGHQYSQSGNLGDVLTTTVNGLPTDGSTIYATLYSLIGGVWVGNAYTFTAFNATSGLAVMQTPTPGSTIVGNPATFTWSADPQATAYWVDISAVQPGANDVFQSGNLGNVTTVSVNSLPANGGTIYVTLYSYVGGEWLSTASTYTSGSGPITNAKGKK